MPKHSSSLSEQNYYFRRPHRNAMGMISQKFFQKPRLLRSQKVFTLTEAPVFAGQNIILHRPRWDEEELENIDYDQPAVVTGIEKDDSNLEVRALCGTLDNCYREVKFELRNAFLTSEENLEENETVHPFSIDQSSKVAFPYKPHAAFADATDDLVEDTWEFWVKIRNRIYKDVQDSPDKSYKGHHYRQEAMEQFRALFNSVKYSLDTWYLLLTKTFHQAETQPSRSDLQDHYNNYCADVEKDPKLED